MLRLSWFATLNNNPILINRTQVLATPEGSLIVLGVPEFWGHVHASKHV